MIGSLAGAAGLESAKLLESTEDPEIKQSLREINDEAVAAGVIGVPSVVVNGTVFSGDERLHKAAAELRELHAEAHP